VFVLTGLVSSVAGLRVVAADSTGQAVVDTTRSFKKGESLPNIGDYYNKYAYDTAAYQSNYIMTGPSQLWPRWVTRVDGIEYELGVDDSGYVKYIQALDTAFVTPEGLSVRNTLEDVRDFTEEEIVCYRGWLCYVRLPSGWKAVISELALDPESWPPSEIRIQFFFKGGS
jgi:hypothetical protein